MMVRTTTRLLAMAVAVWPAASATAWAAEMGTITGVIRYDGVPPALPPLVRAGTEVRSGDRTTKAIPDQSLIVDPKTRGIANAFVYLKKRPDGVAPAEVSDEPLVVRIEDFQFVPHAMLIRAGRPLRVESRDDRVYNFHTYPVKSSPYNMLVAPKRAIGPKVFYERAEPFPIAVRSDIISWMQAWHLPLDHPFGAVTDRQGRFMIEGLPPGTHELTIWHERMGYLKKSYPVEVRPGETTEIDLAFSPEEFEQDALKRP